MELNHDKAIDQLREMLPHGSGINCDWQFDVLQNGKIRASNSYHCMNQHGYYDGYADFTLTFNVHSALTGFKLVFNGQQAQRKNKQYMLRDYLEDTIYHALPKDQSIYSLTL